MLGYFCSAYFRHSMSGAYQGHMVHTNDSFLSKYRNKHLSR